METRESRSKRESSKCERLTDDHHRQNLPRDDVFIVKIHFHCEEEEEDDDILVISVTL